MPYLQQEGHDREIATEQRPSCEPENRIAGDRREEAGDSKNRRRSPAGAGDDGLHVLRPVGFNPEAAHRLELLGAGGFAGIRERGAERAEVERVGEEPGVSVLHGHHSEQRLHTIHEQ